MSGPERLIDEFKKSGEFDRLRRELLAQFQRSERITTFQSRVDDIARQRLASDQKLINMPHEAIHRELMGEIDRYPILERAISEAPLLSDASFAETIRTSVQRILNDSKKVNGIVKTENSQDDASQEASQTPVNHGPPHDLRS